jgi:hypothetical protein
VHNTLLFAKPQKSVLYAPFKSIPTPTWFATEAHKALKVFPLLCEYEAKPSLRKIPGIVRAAL